MKLTRDETAELIFVPGKLAIRFAYATNGNGIYSIDMQTGKEGEWRGIPTRSSSGTGRSPRRTHGGIASRPSRTLRQGRNQLADPLLSGTLPSSACCRRPWPMAANRILLTLGHRHRQDVQSPSRLRGSSFQTPLESGRVSRRAGPGSSFWPIATRSPTRLSMTSIRFAAVEDKALVRVDTVRRSARQGRVPKNASVFFTIFQTFMTGNADTAGNPSPHTSVSTHRISSTSSSSMSATAAARTMRARGARSSSTFKPGRAAGSHRHAEAEGER